MPEPIRNEIDALINSATPHFSYQLRARLRELVSDLASDDPARRYAEEQIELLGLLGYASTKAEQGGRDSRSRPGWDQLPSSAPASEPLQSQP